MGETSHLVAADGGSTVKQSSARSRSPLGQPLWLAALSIVVPVRVTERKEKRWLSHPAQGHFIALQDWAVIELTGLEAADAPLHRLAHSI